MKSINITGLPPGVTCKQEGNTITFSEPIFMEKKPKIKDLLKELRNKTYDHKIGFPEAYLKDSPLFNQLEKAIKSLRKENKRLKKEPNLVCYINPEYAWLFKNCMPVAEFKCAKMNEPSRKGKFWTISTFSTAPKESYNEPQLRFVEFDKSNGGWSSAYEVIAFTETPPNDIVKSIQNK